MAKQLSEVRIVRDPWNGDRDAMTGLEAWHRAMDFLSYASDMLEAAGTEQALSTVRLLTDIINTPPKAEDQ